MLKFKKEHIPNYISVFRIILVPLYVLLFFGVISLGVNPMVSSGAVFVLAGFSDLVDGYLARRNNWITDLGKLLDPFADKMMELAATICLAIRFEGVFWFLAGFLITKEVIMIVGAFLIMHRGKFYVSSAWFGKLATFAWTVMVCLISFVPPVHDNPVACDVLCSVLIAIMVFTFLSYFNHFFDKIVKTKNEILHKNETAPLEEIEETK